jgi:hypothetical protein
MAKQSSRKMVSDKKAPKGKLVMGCDDKTFAEDLILREDKIEGMTRMEGKNISVEEEKAMVDNKAERKTMGNSKMSKKKDSLPATKDNLIAKKNLKIVKERKPRQKKTFVTDKTDWLAVIQAVNDERDKVLEAKQAIEQSQRDMWAARELVREQRRRQGPKQRRLAEIKQELAASTSASATASSSSSSSAASSKATKSAAKKSFAKYGAFKNGREKKGRRVTFKDEAK